MAGGLGARLLLSEWTTGGAGAAVSSRPVLLSGEGAGRPVSCSNATPGASGVPTWIAQRGFGRPQLLSGEGPGRPRLRSNAAPELQPAPPKVAVRGLSPGGLGAGLLLLYARPKPVAKPRLVVVGEPANDVGDTTSISVSASSAAPTMSATADASASLDARFTAPAPTLAATTGAEMSATVAMSSAPAAMSVATGASAACTVSCSAAPSTFAAEAACSASATVSCAAAAPTLSAASTASVAMAVQCYAPAPTISATCAASTVCTVDMSAGACTLQAYDLRGGSYPWSAVVAPYDRAVATTDHVRTVAVALLARTVSVTVPTARTVAVAPSVRAVALLERGVSVSQFSIYHGDNSPPLDIQVLDASGDVNCTSATAVIEWTHQSGTTGTLTASLLTAAEGWWRHTWSAGETAALTAGTYRARITVTFIDGTILTYPQPEAAPIGMTVAAR